MREVKRLASMGIPDGAGIRATVWKKRHQGLRESMLTNLIRHFNSHVENNPENAVNFREIFVYEIFGFALKLDLGCDVQSVHVEELGMTVSRKELYRVLVVDIVDSAIEVDWRDLFPCLKWIPNSLQTRLETVGFRRLVVMKSLIKELKFQADSEEEVNSYLNFLRSEANNSVAETQLAMFVWEVILELSDSPAIVTEWAHFRQQASAKWTLNPYSHSLALTDVTVFMTDSCLVTSIVIIDPVVVATCPVMLGPVTVEEVTSPDGAPQTTTLGWGTPQALCCSHQSHRPSVDLLSLMTGSDTQGGQGTA